MKRKLIELGQGSIVVSIPSKFAKKNSLSKGKEIDIEELNDKELIIRAEKYKIPEKKILLEINKKEEFMQRLIHRYYVAGYSEIAIRFDESNVINLIEEVVDTLIGFEIVELTNERCVLKLVSNEDLEQLDNIKRRLFLLILTTAEDSVVQIKNKTIETLNVLGRFEKQTNKYALFCERILNVGVIQDLPLLSQTYCHVWTLEQLADELKEIWNYIVHGNKQPDESMIELYVSLIQIIRNYYDAYYLNNLDNILRLRQLLKNYKEQLKTNKPGLDLTLLGHFTTIFNMVHHLSLFILPKQK